MRRMTQIDILNHVRGCSSTTACRYWKEQLFKIGFLMRPAGTKMITFNKIFRLRVGWCVQPLCFQHGQSSKRLQPSMSAKV